MSNQLTVSGKNLGSVALPNFCPRCYWTGLHTNFRRPYGIFPGIFSSIDAYTKRMVHRWLDLKQEAPEWLKSLGDIVGYEEPPHWSKFKAVDSKHNILVRGVADGIFRLRDDSYVIADYKTAKFTDTQDELRPMYDAQLNAYARIGENIGFAPVSRVALIYFEPVTEANDANFRNGGIVLNFDAHVITFKPKISQIDRLLAKTREIFELPKAPDANAACKDCKNLDALNAQLGVSRPKKEAA